MNSWEAVEAEARLTEIAPTYEDALERAARGPIFDNEVRRLSRIVLAGWMDYRRREAETGAREVLHPDWPDTAARLSGALRAFNETEVERLAIQADYILRNVTDADEPEAALAYALDLGNRAAMAYAVAYTQELKRNPPRRRRRATPDQLAEARDICETIGAEWDARGFTGLQGRAEAGGVAARFDAEYARRHPDAPDAEAERIRKALADAQRARAKASRNAPKRGKDAKSTPPKKAIKKR